MKKLEPLTKKGILMVLDLFMINVSVVLALILRFDLEFPTRYIEQYLSIAPIYSAVSLVVFFLFGLYHSLWQYASLDELAIVFKATLVSAGLFAFIGLVAFHGAFPRSAYVISWMQNFLCLGGIRLSLRFSRRMILFIKAKGYPDTKRVLIVGAGEAGALVLKELRQHPELKLRPVGLLDDDPRKQRMKIGGVRVMGTRKELKEIIVENGIQEVIIAMPSAPGSVVKEIVELCHDTGAQLRILPGVYEVINGNVTVKHLREVRIEDLLGREPVTIDLPEVAGYLSGKCVLVTGAGGSIGSELCRQIARFDPRKLVLLDHQENGIYELQLELKCLFSDVKTVLEVADIRDKPSLRRVFAMHEPEVVFHAAAYKHVPLMEQHPAEAVKTNVFGTKNVAEMAEEFGTERFVLISTDKAVNPTSIMGATKRIAEMIIQLMDQRSRKTIVEALNKDVTAFGVVKKEVAVAGDSFEGGDANGHAEVVVAGADLQGVPDSGFRSKRAGFASGGTLEEVGSLSATIARREQSEQMKRRNGHPTRCRFVAVRFGNVLGSWGSVVPIFKAQIARGGPVTVTHPEMTRYFMTILEAVQLVIQAGAMGDGGEVFVVDMGEPVKIVDLAKNLIKLSGYEPGRDIRIEYIGIRPGEKLVEEILTAEEETTATRHERIYLARNSRRITEDEYNRLLEELKTALEVGNTDAVRKAVSRNVPINGLQERPEGKLFRPGNGVSEKLESQLVSGK
ncbi:MAG: nucleoside-diphosphate sugar epimerase/dehydratase [Bacillota bacterium]